MCMWLMQPKTEKSLKEWNSGKYRALTHEHGNRCSQCKHRKRKPPEYFILEIWLYMVVAFFFIWVSLTVSRYRYFFCKLFYSSGITNTKINKCRQCTNTVAFNLNIVWSLFCIQFSSVFFYIWNSRGHNTMDKMKWKC